MSVIATRAPVGTSPSKIAENTAGSIGESDDSQTKSYLLRRLPSETAVDMMLGGSNVDSSQGFPWLATDSAITIALEAGEALYGVVASGAQTVCSIRTGR